MRTPIDPMPLRRRDRLRARIGTAKRKAAVVTGATLLTAGGTALTVGAPMVSDAPNVAAVETAPAPAPPPPATLLPPAEPATPPDVPVAPVSNVGEPSAPVGEAGTSIAGGRASYYGAELAGNPTASGEPFDPSKLTAAHRTLPLGTRVRVTHAQTGESVVVRVNDRGPFHGDRVIDLSRAAADAIGLTRSGTAMVELERLPKAGARG